MKQETNYIWREATRAEIDAVMRDDNQCSLKEASKSAGLWVVISIVGMSVLVLATLPIYYLTDISLGDCLTIGIWCFVAWSVSHQFNKNRKLKQRGLKSEGYFPQIKKGWKECKLELILSITAITVGLTLVRHFVGW